MAPRNKPNPGPVLQLTQRQMVLAVSAMMIAALLIFLLGMWVSSFETPGGLTAGNTPVTSKTVAAPRFPGKTPGGPTPPSPGTNNARTAEKEKQDKPLGKQMSPRSISVASGSGKPKKPAILSSSNAPPVRRIPPEDVRIETIEPDDKENSSAPAPDKTQDKQVASADMTTANDNVSDKQGESQPEKQEKPPGDSAKETGKTAAAAPKDTKPAAKETVKEPATASTPAKKYYRVQLSANSPRNRAQTEKIAQEIRVKTGMDIELLEEGNFIKILAGRYTAKSEAQKACNQLKKQKEFENAFVTGPK